jgi:VCBS repeat-containing protein
MVMWSSSSPGVLDNDTDADGDTPSAALVTSTAHGFLSLDANGYFYYVPDTGFTGSDSSTHKVSDGVADSNTVTVTLNGTAWATVSGLAWDDADHDGIRGWDESPLSGVLVELLDGAGNALAK